MKRKRTVFIAINGIRNDPGASNGWTDRFVTWANVHPPEEDLSEKFEYHTFAVTRWMRQRQRADSIGRMIGYYRRADFRVVLVGHSNGCDLIARVLTDNGCEVDSCHLFAPATDEDKIADAIREGMVGRVHIYGSRNDAALKLAKFTNPVFKYGSLGLRGREFASLFPEVTFDHSDDNYGHGTWFARGDVFERTMNLIMDNDAGDRLARNYHK